MKIIMIKTSSANHHNNGLVLVKNRTIVLQYFRHKEFVNAVNEILSSCCREEWEVRGNMNIIKRLFYLSSTGQSKGSDWISDISFRLFPILKSGRFYT